MTLTYAADEHYILLSETPSKKLVSSDSKKASLAILCAQGVVGISAIKAYSLVPLNCMSIY